MSEKKPTPATSKSDSHEQCSIHCEIGLDECVECGICDNCSDGATIVEEELPPHWQSFIEKNKKNP
jgi:hypothetical protein